MEYTGCKWISVLFSGSWEFSYFGNQPSPLLMTAIQMFLLAVPPTGISGRKGHVNNQGSCQTDQVWFGTHLSQRARTNATFAFFLSQKPHFHLFSLPHTVFEFSLTTCQAHDFKRKAHYRHTRMGVLWPFNLFPFMSVQSEGKHTLLTCST